MKKKLEMLLYLVLLVFINWLCYHNIDVPMATSHIVFISLVVLLTLILTKIIEVKRFNIADYWSFAKNHPFLYRFICFLIFFTLLNEAKSFYESMGIFIFVLLNASQLFLLIIEEESQKRRKKKKEEMENEGMQYSDYREDWDK